MARRQIMSRDMASARRVIKRLKRSPLVWQSGLGLILQTLGKGIGFLLTLFLARLLQASEFGVFAYGRNLIFLIAPLATLGYTSAATRYLPDYLVQEKFGEANGFTRHTFLTVFFTGLALAGAAFIMLTFNPDIVENSNLRALYAILPSTPFYALLFVLVSVGRSYGLTTLALAPLLVLQPLAHLGLFFIAVALGAPVDGYTASLAFSVATAIVSFGAFLWLRGAIPRAVLEARCVCHNRDWLGFSLPTAIGLAGSILMTRFPTLVLGFFSPNAEVGRFAIILALAQVLAIPRDAITGALGPAIMRRLSEKDVPGLLLVLRRGVLFSVGVTFAGALVLWMLGDFVLGLLGPSFAGSRLLLLLMIGDQLIQASSLLLSAFLTIEARPRVNIIILCGSAFLCVVLATILASHMGAVGAALGSIGGSLAMLVATAFVCWRKLSAIAR